MGTAVVMKGCVLNLSDFFKVDLSSSKFLDCEIKECIFEESIFKGTSFKKSDFEKSTFKDIDLRETDFSGAKNYVFSLMDNKCKGAKFDYPEVIGLLESVGITVN